MLNQIDVFSSALQKVLISISQNIPAHHQRSMKPVDLFVQTTPAKTIRQKLFVPTPYTETIHWIFWCWPNSLEQKFLCIYEILLKPYMLNRGHICFFGCVDEVL